MTLNSEVFEKPLENTSVKLGDTSKDNESPKGVHHSDGNSKPSSEQDNTNKVLYSLELFGIFQAEEPIIHTEESIGNISKIKRIKILNSGKPISLPALSGNSFRGQMRDLIADHFVEMLQENGEKVCMTPDVYSLIFSGGLMKEGSDISSKMKNLMQNVPLLRIWGSAFGNVMLPSKISVSHLIPLTEESRTILEERLSKLKIDTSRILMFLLNVLMSCRIRCLNLRTLLSKKAHLHVRTMLKILS